MINFSYIPEHVVERENKKYIAYVSYWLDTDVEYYDYINFFFMGKTKRIHEYYYNVGKDVLVDKTEKRTPDDVDYYDENGKIIKDNSEKKNSTSTEKKENNTSNTENKKDKDELKNKEDNVLKVKVYIIEYNYGYQEKVYYDFYSEDDGLNWKIYQDSESEVII